MIETSPISNNSKSRRKLTILSVGDVMLGGRVGNKIEGQGLAYPFKCVEKKLKEGDIVFGNLEIPFDGHNREPFLYDTHPDFKADPLYAPSLKTGCFHILSLANNHIMDWGKDVALETIELVNSLGIKTIGAGVNLNEAAKPVVIEKNGTKLGFLAYVHQGRYCATMRRAGANPLMPRRIYRDLAELRPKVDLLIVSLHFGLMFTDIPSPYQRQLCHSIIEGGADLILGHHPHVIQGVEKYKHGLIAYSLGEFVADQAGGKAKHYRHDAGEKRKETMILRVTFRRSGDLNYEMIPCRIENFQPRILTGDESERLKEKMVHLSALLGQKKHFWEHAGEAVAEDIFRVLAFELSTSGLRAVFSRLKRIRFRHFLILLGYLKRRISRKRER
ncbi:CapA family protein [candidate division TA06 bacterium]|uniref:CapA family protein n=1 Tax=candidate division TA06 bacterium TaxID=2250710 RepID=A0A523XN68_UNCT6|nr:MAG: CapA family protein [candidate division TA06 bacterium]